MNEQKRKRMLRIACLLLAGVFVLSLLGSIAGDAAITLQRAGKAAKAQLRLAGRGCGDHLLDLLFHGLVVQLVGFNGCLCLLLRRLCLGSGKLCRRDAVVQLALLALHLGILAVQLTLLDAQSGGFLLGSRTWKKKAGASGYVQVASSCLADFMLFMISVSLMEISCITSLKVSSSYRSFTALSMATLPPSRSSCMAAMCFLKSSH